MIESGQLTYQREDEDGLVRAAAGGDHSAFDLLVCRHSGRIFRLALAMLGNREDAADIQQEAFLQAFRKFGTFRGESSFGTWVYAIASRLCLMRRRKVCYRREEPSELVFLETDAGATYNVGQLGVIQVVPKSASTKHALEDKAVSGVQTVKPNETANTDPWQKAVSSSRRRGS